MADRRRSHRTGERHSEHRDTQRDTPEDNVKKPHSYTLHMKVQTHGFEMIDATIEGPAPMKDKIRMQFGLSYTYLTTDQAREVAAAIETMAAGIEKRTTTT
jgi:hypothetical protein